MSTKWYCPACGPESEPCETTQNGDDICGCGCRFSTPPDYVTAMQEEIAALKAKVELLEAIECKYIEEIQEYAALKEQG